MDSSYRPKSAHSKPIFLFQIGFWDILTGLPAGILIFMGTVLFTTLFSLSAALKNISPLIILGVISLFVGMLAGITRLGRGPATALAAALIASGILAYLWSTARPGESFDPLVIGAPGIFTTIITCPIGGWLGARFRKAL